MSEPHPTGIEHFDREIGGGLPAGSIIGLVTPPESQGELLLRAIARNGRTVYVTTTRSADAVESWVTADGDAPTGDVDVAYAGVDSFRSTSDDALREWLEAEAGGGDDPRLRRTRVDAAAQLDGILDSMRAGGTDVVIVDPINPLESVDESLFMAFLHEIQDHLIETNNVALLHMVEAPHAPNCRWISLQMADQVWELSVEKPNDRVEFRLTVSKSRSGDVPTRQIKFHLDGDVSIDTSRDIA